MNIAILEDLDNDFLILKNMVQGSSLYSALGMNISRYRSGEALLADFDTEKFQLLFLDMIVDGTMTGMDVAREVRKRTPSLPIVFTTTEKDFALEGFEVQALDYLVKPFTSRRVENVLERVCSFSPVKAYLTVQVDRSQVRFPLDDLMWAAASNHSVELHLYDGKVLRSYMKFRDFCQMIPANAPFHCCSRGIIVNMKYVDYLSNGDFVLTDNTVIPVSRSKRTEMKDVFTEYQIQETRRRR